MTPHPAVSVGVGVGIGLIGSLVGVGGGFFMVPYFTLLLRWNHLTAVGTSLGVIVANASSGVLSFARQKRIDYRTGLVLGIASLPGTFLGKLVGERLNSGVFKIAFGGLLVLGAFLLARDRPRATHPWFHRGAPRVLIDASGERYEYRVDLVTAAILSVFMGMISSLFGVGGGFIHVPILILLYGVPAHVAMATSHFVLVITTGAGLTEYAASGLVEWRTLLWMSIGAFAGAQAGARLAATMSGMTLRRILAFILVLVAVTMVVKAFGRL